MVFGKLFSPGADKTQEEGYVLQSPNLIMKAKKVNRPIIAKFCSYRTRELIFSNKKKVKEKWFCDSRKSYIRMELFTQAKKIFWC